MKKKLLLLGLLIICLSLAACQVDARTQGLLSVAPADTTAGRRPQIQSTEPDLKVAFIGDSGNLDGFERVLTLIKSQGADMVLHQGDFDYNGDADGFFATIDRLLGPDFPYLAPVGNHDIRSWRSRCYDADGCYAHFLKERMDRTDIIPDHHDLDDQMYAVTFRGLKIVFVGEQTLNGDRLYAPYIQNQLIEDSHIWRICSWHKNQHTMQLGTKTDETGWGVYETCKDNGAIIATGHEHSYSRTKTLISMQNLVVDTAQHPPVDGVPSRPDQLIVEPGRTFAFVSGLGGRGMRNQDRCLPITYPYGGGPGCEYIWAKAYTSDQTGGVASFGALFITFNHLGDPARAHGYFMTTEGETIDEFDVTAAGAAVPAATPVGK